MAHLGEKVRKSASARDSHARRICLKFPREPGAPGEKERSRVAREPGRGPRKFRPSGASCPRGGGAFRAATVFPAVALVKVSDYRKNAYVRSFLSPFPLLALPSLDRERLDRFLLSPPNGRVSRFVSRSPALMKASAAFASRTCDLS